jgi:hypothetical protein
MAEDKVVVENVSTKKIILDGKEVTAQQLQEAKNNKSVRIVEDKKTGEYKTLTKLNEKMA